MPANAAFCPWTVLGRSCVARPVSERSAVPSVRAFYLGRAKNGAGVGRDQGAVLDHGEQQTVLVLEHGERQTVLVLEHGERQTVLESFARD